MPSPLNENVGEKLDAILAHIERMDKRDRLRTIGGFFRSIIGLIPIIIIVWSTWYFIAHRDDFLKQVIDMSAKATMESAKTIDQSSVQRLIEQYAKPRK